MTSLSGEKSTQKWPPFRGKNQHRNGPLSGGKSQKWPPFWGNNTEMTPCWGKTVTCLLSADWKSSHLSAAGRGSGKTGNPVFCASKLWSKSRIRSLHVFRIDPFTACVQDWSVHCMCSGWICSLHVFRIEPFTACVQDGSLHCVCSGFPSSPKFLSSDSNTYQFQRNAIYWDKTQTCKFSGQSSLPSYKMTLEQRLKGEKDEKWGGELTCFWLSYVVLEPVLGRILAW